MTYSEVANTEGQEGLAPLVSFRKFSEQVHKRIQHAQKDRLLHPKQRQMLQATFIKHATTREEATRGSPLNLLYTTARAWRDELDAQAVHVGASCLLYIWSADLIDDVQDDDLAGSCFETVGAPIAFNTGLALLALSLKELRLASELEPRAGRKSHWLELFDETFLSAVAGQHADLAQADRPLSAEQVLLVHEAKTSSVALLMRCGALLGRCPTRCVDHYSRFGGRLSQAVQIVDDLRDIYGKENSPDLTQHKQTYPLALFRKVADASARARLERCFASEPVDILEVRRILHDSGVVDQCANTLETLRQEMHREILSTHKVCGFHRQLLDMVDELVAQIYQPPELEESRSLWQQKGGFHQRVRKEAVQFSDRLSQLGAPILPKMQPWSRAHYLYEPGRQCIHYPDVDDLGEDFLTFQSSLFLVPDLERAKSVLREQTPLVIAHEMFHYWRDRQGRLSQNVWHEEYVANRLAVGYALRFVPEVIESVKVLAEEVVAASQKSGEPIDWTVLDSCHEPVDEAMPSALTARQTAVVHMQMLLRLIHQQPDLERDLESYLGENSSASQGALRKLMTSVA